MNTRSRILWRCRRGIREMDILFQGFVDEYYENLSDKEKQLFEKFQNEVDLDILNWVMGKSEPNNEIYRDFVKTFQTLKKP